MFQIVINKLYCEVGPPTVHHARSFLNWEWKYKGIAIWISVVASKSTFSFGLKIAPLFCMLSVLYSLLSHTIIFEVANNTKVMAKNNWLDPYS